MNMDKYDFVNGFYIKKSGPNFGLIGIKQNEWFLKKVTYTP